MPTPPLSIQTIVAPGASLPPVVLLHGFASSGHEDFAATGWPQALADAGRTSHLVDLPGHGASPAVAAESATTTAVVDTIVAAIDTLGVDQVDVVAYSLGARLAWELPSASGDRVRRMVLGGLSPFEPFAAVDVDALLLATGAGAEAGATIDPLTGMMAGMVSALGRDTASLVALIAGLGSEPFSPQDGAPDVPTLFVAGSEDPMSGGIEQLVAAVPGASIVRVPGDHRGALDSAEFREAAVAYLAE
ncbi:hydrolase [Leifsonia sp. Root227]|uniref:alpha/beta fold hydrolase n=1 Tax=Leifsonia sp. Root227 TaxID=1736496 RepID=UPI0006FCCE7E|nr:alpha/beta fold hydrolase [Leifsonia sp. Root227]KRC50442.1 hydrolase [Leifsonia sp. Root227]